MTQDERSGVQRLLDVCRGALGVRGGGDAMSEVEAATDEVCDRLEHLRREADPRLFTIEPRRIAR